jgi:hypothetical protein
MLFFRRSKSSEVFHQIAVSGAENESRKGRGRIYLDLETILEIVMPQEQKNGEWGHRESFNLIYAVAHAHGLCFLPFSRINFGPEGLRWGWLSMLLMFLYAGFARCPEMLIYLLVWLFAIGIQRVNTMALLRRGWRPHSRYGGDSILVRRGVTSPKTALFVDLMFVVGAAGCFALAELPKMVTFVAPGVVSLIIENLVNHEITRRKVRQMQDAEIEGRYVSDLYRGKRTDF